MYTSLHSQHGFSASGHIYIHLGFIISCGGSECVCLVVHKYIIVIRTLLLCRKESIKSSNCMRRNPPMLKCANYYRRINQSYSNCRVCKSFEGFYNMNKTKANSHHKYFRAEIYIWALGRKHRHLPIYLVALHIPSPPPLANSWFLLCN
jgi:hypothetical protein